MRVRRSAARASPVTVPAQPTFVDLFAGAGGLSLGLESAGWRPVLGVEMWPDAVRTYCANRGGRDGVGLGIWDRDIADLGTSDLDERMPNGVDWVVGGPPCQGFSTVGKRDREDPRNRLVKQFARVVKHLNPWGILLENVQGLADMRFVEPIRTIFSNLGYETQVAVLRAADYGVPQLRKRVFFVGSRSGLRFRFPRRTHTPRQYVSVLDAIGDLPKLKAGESATEYDSPPRTEYQRRLRKGSKMIQGHDVSNHPATLVRAISHIPDGGNRRSIPDHLQPKSGFHNSYSRLRSDEPAVGVTGNMGKPSASRCVHPFQDRGLTAREGARLQSFPDTYHFMGGVTSQRLQVANSVPPLLAEVLGRALANESSWVASDDLEHEALLFRVV